jgi:hypothetical protein
MVNRGRGIEDGESRTGIADGELRTRNRDGNRDGDRGGGIEGDAYFDEDRDNMGR